MAIAVRTRAQASPSRPIAQIRSGIVRGSLRLPTQIVEEPNFYVGDAGPGVFIQPAHPLLKFDATGHFVREFNPAVEYRGVDWIDLAADQCTLFYTSEGMGIHRFDVCRDRQLTDFATLPILGPVASGGEVAFALRIRPNGEVLVAAWTRVFRLSPQGNIIQQYRIPGVGVPGFSRLFALNLDPDGKSFWTAEQVSGQVYKVDIATGNVLLSFDDQAEMCTSVVGGVTIISRCQTSGLAVFGELLAAKPDELITAAGATINAVEGASFSGPVATVTDPDTHASASEYSASIDWGDGTPASTGTLSGSGGHFTVDGSHTYLEEGTYTVTVKIQDIDTETNNATASSLANVADASLSSSCATPATSVAAFRGSTARFTDADPNGTSSDYSATIDWGDGSSSAGSVSTGSGNGPYTVSGSHTYASTGTFTITTMTGSVDDRG